MTNRAVIQLYGNNSTMSCSLLFNQLPLGTNFLVGLINLGKMLLLQREGVDPVRFH
jgi:hypothetical protein